MLNLFLFASDLVQEIGTLVSRSYNIVAGSKKYNEKDVAECLVLENRIG